MAQKTKIDSNRTGLRYAEEESFKALPTTPIWHPLEPNSYPDFGGEVGKTARNPINPDRQRQKGVTTDLDAGGGFETDVTQNNLQDLLQGAFYASLRRKEEFGGAGEITAVTAAGDDYAGTGIEDNLQVGSLIFCSGFTNSANNGLKTVATVTGPDLITVSESLVDETPPAAAKLVEVGIKAAAGDLDVDASGDLPVITSVALDFTTLGLIPGEWIYVGGDDTGTFFSNSANNGFARVRSVAANALTLDKTQMTMVTEASTTETIQLFFGRVLKNETGTSIVRRTYQLERTLDAPDDTLPAEVQAEYLEGQVLNELSLNIPTSGKVMSTLTFIGADHTTVTGAVGVKSGTRPALVAEDAFNTSSHFSRIKMAVVSATDAAPTALFAFVTDITINVNNNAKVLKAIGVLGGFEVSTGTFQVDGELTAYFGNVSALAAVRDNSDVTVDAHMVKDNAGISLDLPLVSLGNGKLNVQQDEPVTLPLNSEAATGAKVDPNLNHTLLMVFWDYLPDAAE